MNRFSEVKKKALFFLIMMRGNWKNIFRLIFYIFLLSSIFWCPEILIVYGIWVIINWIMGRKIFDITITIEKKK